AAVRTDIPDWCEVHLARAFPTHWEQEASALSARPPLDLRVNARKVSRADLLLSLKAFPAIPTPVSPIGIRIPPASGHRRHPNLEGLPEFAAGKFEIQD